LKEKGDIVKYRKILLLAGAILTYSLLQTGNIANAQHTPFRIQAWRYGVNAGVNYNMASLGYQNLHQPYPNFDKPNSATDENVNGNGYGWYGGMFLEYLSASWWGVQLRASYDTRDAVVEDIYATPHTEFDTRMSYLSFEPALRIDQHLIPDLSMSAGPLIAVNIHGTYDFKADVAGPITEANNKVSDRNVVSLGITGGVAYDIELLRRNDRSVFVSPFFDYTWIASQRKSVIASSQNSTNDIWSTQTFRFGIRLSWESRNGVPEPQSELPYVEPEKEVVVTTADNVSIILPNENMIVAKDVTGYFPILPYVFFDKGNKDIPPRYIQFSMEDAQKFNEDDLGNFRKNEWSEKETNVDQLMIAYYNVMNIYADRLAKNPDEKLTLRGSDPEENDGISYANKVKSYLVCTFAIDPDRIIIEEDPPLRPSGSILTNPTYIDMINDENRRVTFVYGNPAMYKPVTYAARDEGSIDNDIVMSVGDDVSYISWSLSVTGENKTMNFGPFTSKNVRINPAPLMRGIERGKFIAKTVMVMSDGRRVAEYDDFMLYKVKDSKNAIRYLMLFDYNQSLAIKSYEKIIREEITPGMDLGNSVIVHGHTDIIGNEPDNQKLSQRRSDLAKRIIDNQLERENRKIPVQSLGVGQMNVRYTFNNQLPEGRMYNRNVFVEVIK
jgi:hypothetical protein